MGPGGDMNSCVEAAGGRLGGMLGVCRLAGSGTGVRRVSRGEPGPGGQERGTDWGLVALLVTWENMSSPTAGLDRKNDIGEGSMEVVGGPAGVKVLEYKAGPAPPPPPPTKLSSSASALLTGSEAVTPKLSARLNPPPPPPPGRNSGLAGLLFIINSLEISEIKT